LEAQWQEDLLNEPQAQPLLLKLKQLTEPLQQAHLDQ
jgi:hypothetical protein